MVKVWFEAAVVTCWFVPDTEKVSPVGPPSITLPLPVSPEKSKSWASFSCLTKAVVATFTVLSATSWVVADAPFGSISSEPDPKAPSAKLIVNVCALLTVLISEVVPSKLNVWLTKVTVWSPPVVPVNVNIEGSTILSTYSVVAIVLLLVPGAWVIAWTPLAIWPTKPVDNKAPVKFVDIIDVKPVPVPPVIFIVPLTNELKVDVPIPDILSNPVADCSAPAALRALEFAVITAPNPCTPPATKSTRLCTVKFFVGLSNWFTSVPKTKSSAVGWTVGYEYIIAMLY